MARLFLLAALMLASAGLVPAKRPRQSNPGDDLGALVEQYRHGDAIGAALRFAAWDQKRLVDAMRFVVWDEKRLGDPPALAKSFNAPSSLAALVLLHTEVAILAGTMNALPPASPDLADQHARAALRHIQLIQALARQPGAGAELRTFCRQWYVLVASVWCQFGREADARALVRAGRVEFGADPEFLLAAGSVAETQMGPYEDVDDARAALAPVPIARDDCLMVSGRVLTVDRVDAEQSLRRALTLDPRLVEARLRLGHVLLLENRLKEAQPEFERTLADARRAGHTFAAHLAALFLGQLHERARRFGPARDAYETAIAIYPDGQSAHLALGQLLVASGRQDEGWAAVRRMLGEGDAPSGPGQDFWRLYHGAQFWQAESRLQWMRAWVRR
jgi:tetratricopeptide (TPR) repeat protein